MRTFSQSFVTALAGAGRCRLAGYDTISVSTMEALGVPAYPPSPNPMATRRLRKPLIRPQNRFYGIRSKPSRASVPAAWIAPSLQNADPQLGEVAVVIASERNQRHGDWFHGPRIGRSIPAYSVRVIIGVAINCQRLESAFASKRLTL